MRKFPISLLQFSLSVVNVPLNRVDVVYRRKKLVKFLLIRFVGECDKISFN